MTSSSRRYVLLDRLRGSGTALQPVSSPARSYLPGLWEFPYTPTMLIDLALAVLEEQHRKAKDEKRQVPEVRLALHVLRPYVPREWLVAFWEACGHDKPLYRQAELTRTLNGIRLRVKRD